MHTLPTPAGAAPFVVCTQHHRDAYSPHGCGDSMLRGTLACASPHPRQHPSQQHQHIQSLHATTPDLHRGAPHHATQRPPPPTPHAPLYTHRPTHTLITPNSCRHQHSHITCPISSTVTHLSLVHVRAPIQQQPCHGLVTLQASDEQWSRPIRRLHSPSITPRQHPSPQPQHIWPLHTTTPHTYTCWRPTERHTMAAHPSTLDSPAHPMHPKQPIRTQLHSRRHQQLILIPHAPSHTKQPTSARFTAAPRSSSTAATST
jgi:hypothetical protein